MKTNKTIWQEYNGLLKMAEQIPDKELREGIMQKLKKLSFARKRKDAVEKIEDLFPALIEHLIRILSINESSEVFSHWRGEIQALLNQINFRYNNRDNDKYWLSAEQIDKLSEEFMAKYYPCIEWKKLSDFGFIKLTENEILME